MKKEHLEIQKKLEERYLISSGINLKFKELIYQIEENTTQLSEVNPRGLPVKESLLTGFSIDPLYPIVEYKQRPFSYR